MTETKQSPTSLRKLIIPFATAIAAMLFSAVIFILPPPISHQLHTTSAGQHDLVFVGPDIRINMNANSSMTVSSNQPPEIELLQGSVYFDITNSDANTGKLVLTINEARIKNIGTQFSAERQNNGGQIAIADGFVEIQIGSQSRLVHAGQQVTFDINKITQEAPIDKSDVAPWRLKK